jgi:predicted ester cyclase
MSVQARNIESIRNYLRAIESGVGRDAWGVLRAWSGIYNPNLLLPKGNRHELAGALEGAERGRKLMAGQKYLITHEMAEGEQVALEVEWKGTLAVPFGTLPAGSQMKAYCAMFLEFKEGKIVGQRNYDCFE